MGIDIQKSCSLSLDEKTLISYGGTSKIYKPDNEMFCYKIYKDRIPTETKNIIQKNILSLSENPTPDYLVTPRTLYIDETNTLSATKLPYINGVTGYNECHKHYNNFNYIRLFVRLIDLIMKLTRKEYIVTDLKLSNIMWDEMFNFFAIDNDFTFYQEVPEEIAVAIRTNANVRTYNEIFGELKPDYNIYRLYFILARLLLSLDEYYYLSSIKPTKRNIKEQKIIHTINFFIQKNRSIPQEFKMQMRNLFTGNKEITFHQDMKDDLVLCLKKRIGRNHL